MINEILQEPHQERAFYLNQLKNYLNTPLIKVITGQRRVGKSMLLKQLIRYLLQEQKRTEDQIFYMNKEFPEFDHISSYQDLRALLTPFIAQQTGRFLIAIDEIQEIQDREKTINGLLSKYGQQAEIVITGSNSHLLSSELATLLSGRYVELPMYPLSYDEVATFLQQKKSDQLFEAYLHYGGLP